MATEKHQELLDKIADMKVTELAGLVKAMEEKFGISAAAPVAAGAAAGGEAEEKTDFTVVLQNGGAQKIAVIKVVREVLGLGLKEAKDLVDAAPKELKVGMKKEEAEELKKKIEAAGGKAELK